MNRLTTEEFIKRAKEVHGDKYDYSKVDYVNANTKVCIICKKHGEFWQTPYRHICRKQGCPKCIGRGMTLEEFIKKANDVHGNKYDYSKTDFSLVKNTEKDKVCITCKKHGDFWQLPSSHLNGCGCMLCGKASSGIKASKRNKMPIEEFISRANRVHNSKYDYSKVSYKTTNDKVCIICPEHGEFWQTATSHINKGNGCPKCHPNHKRSVSEFIDKAKATHGEKYDYSKVNYINNTTPVCIICPEHGEFWQRPNSHISRKQGCPKCAESKLESTYCKILSDNGVNFERQKCFKDIKFKGALRYDFYDSDNNILIECQGIQHIRNCNQAFGDDYFIPLLERDKIKFDEAKKHDIELKYIVEKRYYKEFIKFGGIYSKENTSYIEL